MLGYYLVLAVRSLKRNIGLTILVIAAVAVGVSASMTIVTIYRGMAADPIPDKSGQLFAPQLDSWGPKNRHSRGGLSDGLQDLLSYTDAVNLLKSPIPRRQAVMYTSGQTVTPQDPHRHSFVVSTRATSGDFFAMFEVPLLYGSAWTQSEDAQKAQVALISRDLNDRMFDGRNSVGATIRLNDRDYRVAGVLDRWDPQPRFYDVGEGPFVAPEEVYIPFTQAIEVQLEDSGNGFCNNKDLTGWDAYLASDCIWLSMWVELPSASDASAYRKWLAGYAAEQQRLGRFQWASRTALRNVPEWLDYHHVVLQEVQLLLLVALGFLMVCLLNATGLLLAKTVGGVRDLALRRALGARRTSVLGQCLVEMAVVGFIGGLLGLLLTHLSLWGLIQMMGEVGARLRLLRLDPADLALTVLLAVSATLLAGLYPTLRAVRMPPAPQLKAL